MHTTAKVTPSTLRHAPDNIVFGERIDATCRLVIGVELMTRQEIANLCRLPERMYPPRSTLPPASRWHRAEFLRWSANREVARIVSPVIAPTKRRLASGEASASGGAASMRPT